MVKALLCKEVEAQKLEVTSISKILCFYGVEALSFGGILRLWNQQRGGSLAWRNLEWRFVVQNLR